MPLHADGSTTKVNVFLHLQGGTTGPDGLATNPAGDLAVCQCGLGAVFVFSRLGEPKLVLRSPEGLDVTAAAFGGADGRTLYVTEAESGTILVASMADGDEPPPSPAAR